MGNADKSEYKYFDKRFLIFPDVEYMGERVFHADSYKELINDVESGDFSRTKKLIAVDTGDTAPFEICDSSWILAYFDPAYEARVAYSQGKTIEYRSKDGTGDGMWHVSTVGVIDPECYDYRVKPDETKWYACYFEGKLCVTDEEPEVYCFSGTKEECRAWVKEHTPKTRRMTNKELARWCADNKGQVKHTNDYVSVSWSYMSDNEDNKPVRDGIRIREWDSSEWHEPLVEVK